ncbi:MAG: intradiol ring-cleavage dioxygenase [Chloroflexota bacterium]
MRNITEENLTQIVLDRTNTDDARTNEILTKLITHMHAFIRDVEPTEKEWFHAIDFLTRTGQMCDDKRQEFILLSDVLGVSMLVDAINHRGMGSATETTVTGPFHAEAPTLEMGANVAKGPELARAREKGQETVVSGVITDDEGHPIEGAMLDIWHADDIGFYDVQDEKQPEQNLRGIFKTGADGRYWFRTIRPTYYPVPTDGPVGELLNAAGRHPMRPSHIHFMIGAPGYERLITHIFSAGDPYLDGDAVFGVKESLIAPYTPNDSMEEAARYGFNSPFFEMKFDFVLKNAGQPVD